jgi:hypothetical protein
LGVHGIDDHLLEKAMKEEQPSMTADERRRLAFFGPAGAPRSRPIVDPTLRTIEWGHFDKGDKAATGHTERYLIHIFFYRVRGHRYPKYELRIFDKADYTLGPPLHVMSDEGTLRDAKLMAENILAGRFKP